MIEKADFKKLARDVYFNKNLEFGEVSGQDALRNAIKDALGGEYNVYSWQKHKYDVFQIISTAVDAVMPKLLTDQFSNFADIRTVSVGDKPLFEVQDPRAIRVGRVAAGANDMRRQTITNKTFTIETEWFGAAVYAEFDQFMAGDIDWNALVDRIAEAFKTHIQATIGSALNASYTLLGAKDKIEGSLTLDGLVALAQRIQVKSGKNVAIYGTKAALSKIAELANVQLYSGEMKNELNTNGFLGVVRGMKLIEIPQAFKVNSDEFALDDTKVLILPEGEKIGRQFSRRSAVSDYIRHIASSLGDDDLSGLTIAVDCANGSASTTADQLFHSLGVKPLLIHAQPDGTNINLNCGSTHLESLRDFVIKHRCRCGIAFDGDADRCLAVDENGDLIDGDQMIAIFASHMKKNGKLANNTAVVTVMSNLGFFHFAKENGIETEATGVGDRYVLERMREKGHCIGGEQSGHIIFSEYATTGDGQLTAVQLLNILKQEDVPLSTLASCMKKFPQVCKNIEANAETKQAFSDSDYLKEYIENKNQQLGDNGRILVRPSGTEPLIRIMVEGRSMDEISAIAEEIAEEIQKNT